MCNSCTSVIRNTCDGNRKNGTSQQTEEQDRQKMVNVERIGHEEMKYKTSRAYLPRVAILPEQWMNFRN